MKPTVLIFRKRLLPWSETFIAAQGRALKRYHPVFVGYQRDPAGAAYLDGCEQILLSDHEPLPGVAIGKALLKVAGRVPRSWLRALEATRPRLVHAHFATSAQPALRLAEALRLPLVMTFHGHDIAKTPRNRAHAERRRALFTRVDRAIAVSDFIADRLREAGCPEEKIVVHHIGVDTDRFVPAADAVTTPRVLFVGRLVEKKGLDHLLRAFPAVLKRVPGAELVIVGDGPLRARHASLAASLDVPARFVGVQTPDEVHGWLRASQVLAAPSVVTGTGDAEGLPVTIMEALATGLPVVAFPSGGSADGVRDGETGFLVGPGDETGLADAIVRVLSEAPLRTAMSAAARRLALDRFSISQQTTELERIYDEVLGQAGVCLC
ncbi:MAG TPA: glycosyltransferase [Longimicrobiales bacterium]|nr:glycosyltransferase [Longimicrobiales bacterium]